MSNSPVQLRPYQQEAIEAVLQARRAGLRRLLVSLPTGAGKTVIFSHLSRLARRQVLVLAHREELLGQAKDKLEQALGQKGLVAIERGAERAPAAARILVCSIRSLHEERLARLIAGRDIGLIIYDECHHAAAEDNRRVLSQLGVFEPDWTGTLLGFTATTQRGDGQGLDEIFEKIVYSRTLPQMIEDGYLAPLSGYRISTHADLTRLGASGRDFAEEELAEAVDIEERNALVARSIQELARDRRTIVFCVTVGHAKNLARSLRVLGVPTGVVYGAMDAERRVQVLADFRAGRLQVVTNVGVLTEGFDDPGVSCVAMARPTRSAGFYAQCVGRGTRLAPGKKNCLILDFVDASSLDLCTLPSLFGLPRDLDLQGEEATEARQVWERIQFDRPGFELEAGAVTLPEIVKRAEGFDPLGLQVHEEVQAISGHAWFSLGKQGLGLHIQSASGKVSEILILRRGARGKMWEVTWDEKKMARFSSVEEAVAAVDYEVERRGPAVARSALAEASWRQQEAPVQLRLPSEATARLPRLSPFQGRPAPRKWAEVLQLRVWLRVFAQPSASPQP